MKEFVYILPNVNGGVATVVTNLLKYTQYPDVKKTVILVGLKNSTSRIAHQFRCDRQIIIDYTKWDSPYSIYRKIKDVISDESIIISNDGTPELPTVKYFGLDNPVVYIMHGNCKYYYRIVKQHYDAIEKAICVSSYLKKRINDDYPHLSAEYINFPIPIIEFTREYNLKKKIRIAYVGRVDIDKGCEYFSEFVARLTECGVDFDFHIIGDGKLLPALQEEFKDRTNITLHGQQPHETVVSILKESDVCILFSKAEGLPVCLVEAMMVGAIPIAFDLPSGIRDIITDGETGYVVGQGEVGDAIDRISKLATDSELRCKISQTAMHRSLSMFNPQQQALRYETTFLETSSVIRKGRNKSLIMRVAHRLPMPLFYRIRKYLNL